MKIKLLVLLCVSILIGTIAYARMTTMIVGGQPAAAAPGIPTATAHYLFNNNLNDETTDHNASAGGGFTYDTDAGDKVEGAASGIFDDTPDYAYVADHIDFDPGDGDFSVSFWFQSTWIAGGAGMVSKIHYADGNIGWRVFADDDGAELNINLYDGTNECLVETAWSPSDNVYYHIVVTFDTTANEIVAYASTESSTFGDVLNTSGSPVTCNYYAADSTGIFSIGWGSLSDLKFFGNIDDLRWWKGTALTPTQAQALYDLY